LDAADTALDNYLDSLFNDIERPVDRAMSPLAKVDIRPADTTRQQSLQPDPINPPATCQDRKEEVDEGLISRRSGPIVPAWARSPFQTLLFQVSDVTLALPLKALGGILQWNDRINDLPGLPEWVLGVMLDGERKILVVDTARFLMPERVAEEKRALGSSCGYVLLIEDSHWGLAVDGLRDTVKLETHQVHWRLRTDKRSWLAGIIVDQLSILLDVEGLFAMLPSNKGTRPSART
jgi:purine-binding chemotaxis protein CheW